MPEGVSKPSMRYSAYIICFNNVASVRRTAESLLAQLLHPAELIVVDDGSSDGSMESLGDLAVRIIRHNCNLGRGAARARAMAEAREELVLCCDATNVLAPDFAGRALAWFADGQVASVFGPISDPCPRGVVARWRSRHLFKDWLTKPLDRCASLSTYGAVMRKSRVDAVGGFDPGLRHNEDGDLGRRLLAAGYQVVFDPTLATHCSVRNPLGKVLERYWRWYAGQNEDIDAKGYLRSIVYSLKVMALHDIAQRDPLSALISLISPHYCFWTSVTRRISRTVKYH